MGSGLHHSSSGSLVAAALVGSWRGLSSPLNITEAELDQVTPLLYASGSAALGWWRVRQTNLSATPSAEVLHQAYRTQALQSVIHEKKIVKIFRLLRQASVDAILVKGWLAAGVYPDRALRPYGDMDLCFRREHFHTAKDILASPEAKDCWVDPHLRFSELEPRSFDELFARSKLVDLGTESIRIMGPEDHLALLAIHLLKHGAWRPLWLCDIGAAIESLPETFDWDVCLGRSKRHASWIINTIGLAHNLLDARIDSLPVAQQAREQPAWLINSVLKQWSNLLPADHLPIRPRPLMAYTLRHPGDVVREIRERWPDPITATFNLGGRFSEFPRLPFQLGDFLRGAGTFLFHLRAKLAEKN